MSRRYKAQQLKCVALLVPGSPCAVFQPGLSYSQPLCAAHSAISLTTQENGFCGPHRFPLIVIRRFYLMWAVPRDIKRVEVTAIHI